MIKKRTYRQRIFIYFFSVFILFAIAILAFQFNREKTYRHNHLESRLDQTVEFVHRYIDHNNLAVGGNFGVMDSILYMFSEPNTRITVINKKGDVLYDSFMQPHDEMQNHLSRPEMQKALYAGKGSNIRRSETTDEDFYYYAKYFGNYYVRAAVVYDVKISNFLKTERLFIFFMATLFVLMWFMLHLVTKRLGEFTTKLRDFAVQAGRNEDIDPNIDFPDSEFGDIRRQIVKIYNRLKRAKDDLSAEKERLYSHLYALNVGIAFFSAKKEKILANSHFIQYINLISEKSTVSANTLFDIPEFKPLIEKIESYLPSNVVISPKNLPHVQETISRQETYFKAQGIVFADKSFEILIEDITKPEKRRLLKQQITSNIAHELKTPLSSIKGYLETILNNKNLPDEKLRYFIERAFAQSERLNELLSDLLLLNNIEDAGDLFDFKKVRLRPLIKDVIENFESRLSERSITVRFYVEDQVIVYGNDSLLSSVFQNLIENSINYAGDGIAIQIRCYLEDKKFYYFSYSNSGKGIAEEHLGRIFERFYRVDEGRTRSDGGTGLGLAIVKNAIQLHKGEISVRNRSEGGIEFLFSLAK